MIEVFGRKIPILIADLSEKELDGAYSRERKTIVLHKDLAEEDIVITALHEIIHAILHRQALCQVIPEEIEELIAESISTWLDENYDFPEIRQAFKKAKGKGR